MESLISGDLRKTVKHPYVFLACQFETSEVDYGTYVYRESTDWKSWSDKRILKNYGEDGNEYEYSSPNLGYIKHDEYSHWPCSVLEDEGDGRYTVRIHQSPLRSGETQTTLWEENDLPRILTNYRRESIRYFIRPTAQDHTLPNAFRHHIGVPEGTYPELWKNLKKK